MKKKANCFGFTFNTPGSNYEWTISTTFFASGHKHNKRGITQGRPPYTHEQFIGKLEKVNSNVKVLGEYHRTTEKIRVKCEVCGHEWFVTPHNLLLGRGCPECWHKKHSVALKNV